LCCLTYSPSPPSPWTSRSGRTTGAGEQPPDPGRPSRATPDLRARNHRSQASARRGLFDRHPQPVRRPSIVEGVTWAGGREAGRPGSLLGPPVPVVHRSALRRRTIATPWSAPPCPGPRAYPPSLRGAMPRSGRHGCCDAWSAIDRPSAGSLRHPTWPAHPLPRVVHGDYARRPGGALWILLSPPVGPVDLTCAGSKRHPNGWLTRGPAS